jgi:hypothetical protein
MRPSPPLAALSPPPPPLRPDDGFPIPLADGFPIPLADGFPGPLADGFPAPAMLAILLLCGPAMGGCTVDSRVGDDATVAVEETEEEQQDPDDPGDDIGPGDDDDDAVDDDDTVGDDDSETEPVPAENLCDDGSDNDNDGLVDCEDPDCAGQLSCSWPASLDMHTELAFDANGTAKAFGVGDCVLEFAGLLGLTEIGNICPSCDATYEGAVSYGPDNCPEDYITRPPVVAYGMIFLSPGEREIWKRESETGEWSSLGNWTPTAAGPYVVERQEPVFYDSFLGELEVGAFVMVQTFTDSP